MACPSSMASERKPPELTPSTTFDNISRGDSERRSGVSASTAQWHSARRAKRPKIAKLAANDRLRSYVQDRLAGTVMAEDGRPCLAQTWAPGVVDVMAAARTDIG